MTRLLIRAGIVGIAIGAITWVYGMQGIRPALVALGVVGVAVAVHGFVDATYRGWPDRQPTMAGGGTGMVSRLADRIRRHTDRTRGPDAGLTHQLRALVSRRLSRRGLAVTDPRADTVLGPGVRDSLLSEDPYGRAALDRIVTSIEQLDAERSPR